MSNPAAFPDVLILESTSTNVTAGKTYRVVSVECGGGYKNGPNTLRALTVIGNDGNMVYLPNAKWEWAVDTQVARQMYGVQEALARAEAAFNAPDKWTGAADLAPSLRALRDHVRNLERIAQPLRYPLYEVRRGEGAGVKPTAVPAADVLLRLRGALRVIEGTAKSGTMRDAALACWAILRSIEAVKCDLAGAAADPSLLVEHRAMIDDVIPAAERLHKALDLKEPMRPGAVMAAANQRLALEKIERTRAERARDEAVAVGERLRSQLAAKAVQIECIERVIQKPLATLIDDGSGAGLVPLPQDVLEDVVKGLKAPFEAMPGLTEVRRAYALRRLGQFYKGARKRIPPVKSTEPETVPLPLIKRTALLDKMYAFDAATKDRAPSPWMPRRTQGAVIVRQEGPWNRHFIVREDGTPERPTLRPLFEFDGALRYTEDQDKFLRWATEDECAAHGIPFVARPS